MERIPDGRLSGKIPHPRIPGSSGLLCFLHHAYYAKPAAATHRETTLYNVKRIASIAQALHARGGKVIANINVTLAWEVGNAEPYRDGFTAGFHTDVSAVLDVIFGRFSPVGKMPITLPRGDEVLKVDENGKAYAYRDTVGNYYEMGFGLNYLK